jgi:uncharacterized paraquat-inducible protein A
MVRTQDFGAGVSFEFRECVQSDCRLRIPVLSHELPTGRCPRCGGEMRVAVTGTLGSDKHIP